MTDEKICDDCAKFQTPDWISDSALGLCAEEMFGRNQASDKNESACKHFKEKEE